MKDQEREREVNQHEAHCPGCRYSDGPHYRTGVDPLGVMKMRDEKPVNPTPDLETEVAP